MADVFHKGERALQKMTGEQGPASVNGRIIAATIPVSALGFLSEQQTVILGGADSKGDLWARLIAGPVGFLTTDGTRSHLFVAGDANLQLSPGVESQTGDPIGVLCLDLSTRRRLRVNGRLVGVSDEGWQIEIDQAYPNCPKYIQKRVISPIFGEACSVAVEEGETLTDTIRKWIKSADTFFVVSAHSSGATDVSHRGGQKGFVRVLDGVLHVPDYPGNSMFNTLGNFYDNPHAGVSFVDFETNRQLQLTGDVRLELADNAATAETGGTGRWWRFTPRRWRVVPLNRAFDWTYVEASRFNPVG